MKTKHLILAILAPASLAFAEGTDTTLEKCPPAVQQAIQASLKDGKLDDIEEITVDGRSLYVADVDLPKGGDLKVHVNGDGKLLKTAEEIAPADLPAAVSEAAIKLATDGRIDSAEKEIAGEKTTYLVEIDRKGGADLDVVFDETGAVVSQREDTED